MERIMAGGWRLPLAALVLVLCVKLPLLAIYGPTETPDTGDYLVYARAILDGSFNTVSLTDSFSPRLIFRSIGYPAVIAATKAVAGAGWAWLLVGMQIALTLVVVVLICRLLRLLRCRPAWALAGGVTYGISLPLVLDQVILTDSLAASFVAIVLCGLARCILLRRRLTAGPALAYGLLLAATFLLREATLILVGAGMLPLIAAAALADRLPWRGWRDVHPLLWRRVAVAIMVLLPMLAADQAYRAWNQQRIGRPLVTTAAQSVMLQALAVAAERRPDIFDTAHLFDRVARETFKTYSFDEVWRINARLYDEYGMTADRIAAAGYGSYFRAWLNHPVAMAWIPLYHVRISVARSAVQPIAAIQLLHLWSTGQKTAFGDREAVMAGRWDMAPVLLLEWLCRVAGIAIFAAFLFGTPWRLWRQGATPELVAGIGVWLLFVAVHTGYAFVHLEARYLTPTIAGATIFGLFNLQYFWTAWRQRRAAAASRA